MADRLIIRLLMALPVHFPRLGFWVSGGKCR